MKFKTVWQWLGIVVLALALLITGCGSTKTENQATSSHSQTKTSAAKMVATAVNGDLHVSMLDVGQADATLIQYKGKTMLIDTGDPDHRDTLVKDLKDRNIKEIDTIIITHPHGDHLGGMAALFKTFTIHQIYDNGQASNTAMYRNYLKNIKAKHIQYQVLKKGDVITLGDDISFTVLAPSEPYFPGGTDKNMAKNSVTNNNSIVCKMQYKDFSILFSGDAEHEAEQRIIKDYKGQLHADVLKVGHHGSKTASSLAYVQVIAPEAATISCAAGNEYKFPHKQPLDNLAKVSAKVYRTDQDGTISIVSDGKTYSISKAYQ
jgi:competence protein ComEC